MSGFALSAACSANEVPGSAKIDDAGHAADERSAPGEKDVAAIEDAPAADDAPAIYDAPAIEDGSAPRDPSEAKSDSLSEDAASTSFEAIIAGYRNWQPPLKSPEAVSAYIFTICRAPNLREQAFAKSEHGNQLYLLDWTNSLAAQAVGRKGVPGFDPGAAIVKEKLVRSADGGFDLVALGIMVKQEPGFDAANGDWDYGYWEKDAGLIRTPAQTTHCGGCHAGVQDTDYVFMDAMSWLTNP